MRLPLAERFGRCARQVHHVARKLDVNGPLALYARRYGPVDVFGRGRRIVDRDRRDRYLLEDLPLRVEVANPVMKEGCALTLIESRRAADDDDRGLLGVGARDGVHRVQSSDGIGHADSADAVHGVPLLPAL